MKKLMLLFVAVAGLSFLAMGNTAEAWHHPCRSGGYYRSSYRAPLYRTRTYYGGGYGSYYSRPSHNYHGGPGYYGGRGGYHGRSYYGSGFGIQTRGFGLYIH